MITKQNLLFEIAQMLKLETINKITFSKDKIKFALTNKKYVTISVTQK